MEYAINENNTKNIEKDNMDNVVPPVQRASLSKRIIAGILDFFIFIFLMFLIQPFAINPTVKYFAKDYNMHENQILTYYKESGLAIVTDDKKLHVVDKDKYIEVSQKYFNEYCSSGDDGKACSSNKKTFKEILADNEGFKDKYEFDEEGNFQVKKSENETDDEFKAKKENLEYSIYIKSVTYLTNSQAFKEHYTYINTVSTISVCISTVISLIICYLLPPLISKKSQTIGQMIFGLSIVNKDGYKAKKWQILVRFLAFSVLNFVLGITFLMIVPLISLVMMFFTKNNTTLHDLCSQTVVIDDKLSTIYNNKEAQMKATQKESENETNFIEDSVNDGNEINIIKEDNENER